MAVPALGKQKSKKWGSERSFFWGETPNSFPRDCVILFVYWHCTTTYTRTKNTVHMNNIRCTSTTTSTSYESTKQCQQSCSTNEKKISGSNMAEQQGNMQKSYYFSKFPRSMFAISLEMQLEFRGSRTSSIGPYLAFR